MLPHPKLIFLAGIILLVALATPSLAATLYKWTAEDGSTAFTDDPKRIPERYRSQAKTLKTGGLSTYERFTPSDSARQSEHQALLQERLERLRETNRVDRAVAPQGVAKGPVSETILQVNDSTALRIPATVSDDGPIVVEEVRVRRKGSNFTIHDTVVRQGDKVLLVVRPDSNWRRGRVDYIDEDELFE
jgi:hypothetical protein